MQVEDYIYRHTGTRRRILLHFHELLTAELGLTDKIRYRIPFYYGRSWLCYLNPIKPDGIELAFLRGSELANEQGLLDRKGRKRVCGLDIYNLKAVPHDTLYEILQEAILLDESSTYSRKAPPG
jgi:hypothetical protein